MKRPQRPSPFHPCSRPSSFLLSLLKTDFTPSSFKGETHSRVKTLLITPEGKYSFLVQDRLDLPSFVAVSQQGSHSSPGRFCTEVAALALIPTEQPRRITQTLEE